MRAKNEFKFIAEAYQAVHTEKIKGADGKACWGGYRYAGTEDGKDKCVKVEDEETQQKFKIYFTTALNPDGEDAEGWISYGTDEEDAWDNLYNYFKSIPPGPGYRGRNLMSFYRVQIEPYKEGDPCSTAMGPCEDITVKSEDNEVEFPNSEYGRSLERDAKQHEQEDKEMRDDIERLQKLVADGYVRLHKVIENEETGKKEDHYQVLAPWQGSTSFPILKAQGWEEVPFPSIRLTLNEPGTASVQLRPPYTDIHKYLDKGYKVVDNYVKATQSEDDEENEDENLDVTQGDTSADDFREVERRTPL